MGEAESAEVVEKQKGEVDYLPLGSVVLVKGTDTKFMIIARAMCIHVGNEDKLFDYGACPFPTGIIGDKVVYFNQKEIEKILFQGYSDDDDLHMRQVLHQLVKEADIAYADPKKLSEQLAKGARRNGVG